MTLFRTRPMRRALLLAPLALAACQPTVPGNNGQAVAIGPNTLNIADAAIAGGDPNMALQVTQSVLETDPNNVDALVHEGDAYYALARCPAAMAAYKLALTHDPKNSLAQTGLGRCLLKTDPASAEQAFLAATADDPGNAKAWNDLGIARDLQANFAGAVEPYQKALLADPSMTAAEVNLGLSLALSGHPAEGLQYLGPLAAGQNATPKIRQNYALALVASGRDTEARQVLAIDLPPDQVNRAMAGFEQVIAQSQSNPPPAPPPPPTVPQVASAPVTSAPIAPPQPLTPAAAGPAVQLGALNSQADAERDWQTMSTAQPALFQGKTPQIVAVERNGKILYRLRVGGFASEAEAQDFCRRVTAAGDPCTVANF